MSQPAHEDRDFHFSFRSEMDKIAPDLAGYMQVIRVDGATGKAVMLLNRYGGDLAERPVGLFGMALSKPQVAGVAEAIERIKWAELPRPQGGDINAAVLSIDFSRGTKIIQRSLNSRNAELLRELAPVMNQVTALSSALREHPLRAVTVSVAQSGDGFRLTLRNVGSGPVLLADPRHVPPGSQKTRAVIRVAAAPPGVDFTDLVWESVPLAPLGSAPAVVILGPGKTHEVNTVAWTAKQGGDHYLQAAWKDYVGPQVNPHDVMDAVPDPDKMGDPRPYVIRGAAFSTDVKFVASRPPQR